MTQASRGENAQPEAACALDVQKADRQASNREATVSSEKDQPSGCLRPSTDCNEVDWRVEQHEPPTNHHGESCKTSKKRASGGQDSHRDNRIPGQSCLHEDEEHHDCKTNCYRYVLDVRRRESEEYEDDGGNLQCMC